MGESSNSQDLVYVLVVDANDPNLGKPFAVRIDVFNALQQNGVPDEGAGGTNYRFTQGNFDNVRLTVQAKALPVPEPAEEEGVLVNSSFEQPEGGQIGFDGVPGWATDVPVVNSGIQADPNAPDGVQVAYLGGGDPAIWQMSSLVVQEGDVGAESDGQKCGRGRKFADDPVCRLAWYSRAHCDAGRGSH